MKKNLILLLSLLFYTTAFTQISITHSTQNDNQAWQIVKKSNGNYLIVINEADRTRFPFVGRSKILEMNGLGVFIDSSILQNNSQNLFTDRLIPVSDGYIGLGQISNRVDSRAFLWVFRLNKQLQRMGDSIIPIKESVVVPAYGLDKDSNIIFACGDISRLTYFGKINKNGVLYSWKRDSSSILFPSNSLLVRKDSLLYTIFMDHQSRFYTYDTAFNKIHESPLILGSNLGLQSVVKPLNDSIVCISGKGKIYNNPSIKGWRHLLGVTTLKGREIFRNFYSTSNDTAIWGAWVHSIDTTKQGEWYWGGTHNYIVGAFGRDLSQSSFILHKLNRDFSTKWTKKYGGDAYYEMYGVLTTDDGGCMMYGTRYDYNSIPKYDAYILKVNADGLKTSESFIPIALHSIDIYPNPSSGLINLDFKEPLSDGQIRVMDTQGRLVHQTKLQENISSTLDLSFLNDGVYFIQVFEKNRLFSANKWIKKRE